MHLTVVGIASDVDDLISGHSSLRRHLVAVQIGPMGGEALTELLMKCAASARIEIDERARRLLVMSALGSPYHLRLFGFYSAITAMKQAKRTIDVQAAQEGLREAYREWGSVAQLAETMERIMRTAPENAQGLLILAFIGAYVGRFDADKLLSGSMAMDNARTLSISEANGVIAGALPLLSRIANSEVFMFTDTLMPQLMIIFERDKDIDLGFKDKNTA